MTEVPAITNAMTPAEAYVRRLVAARAGATDEGVAALSDLTTAIRATVAALKSPAPRIANCDALGARLAALRDSLPEVAPAEEFGALDLDIDLDAIELDAPAVPEAPGPEAPAVEAPPVNLGAS